MHSQHESQHPRRNLQALICRRISGHGRITSTRDARRTGSAVASLEAVVAQGGARRAHPISHRRQTSVVQRRGRSRRDRGAGGQGQRGGSVSESPRESARTLAGSTGGTNELSQHTQLLIDTKAAAAMLALGTRTLWTLTKCNAIPSRHIGRSVRYCPSELRAWISAGCPTEPGSADRVRKGVSR